jgi:hypothetical protein
MRSAVSQSHYYCHRAGGIGGTVIDSILAKPELLTDLLHIGGIPWPHAVHGSL